MSPNEGQEELEEVQMELRQRDEEVCILAMFYKCSKLITKW